jgi:hypothetical protein
MNDIIGLLIWITLMWLCNRLYWLQATIAAYKWDTRDEYTKAIKSWKVAK